ncbi:MAG: glycosyltransferase family 4 protein [Candidatus Omnitrophica bacterium]|nr:glycosyltransferase family 4 protein [Candidatus Omnitrophota bacterium]
MKIGIDTHSCFGQKTGLGVYTENLVRSIIRESRDRHIIRCYAKPREKDWNTAERMQWENYELLSIAFKDRIRLLHVPCFAPPIIRPFKVVVTVHDLIGMKFPNQMGWPSRFYWGKWLPVAVRSANAIITDSENSKRDIMQELRIPEKKIHLVYPSGHEGFSNMKNHPKWEILKKRLNIAEKYFLSVGTLEPRKNLERVIRAFDEFLKQKRGDVRFQLVIAGSRSFAQGRAYELLVHGSQANLDDILFTDYLSQEELNLLYSNSQALIFPSLYEGFGIPVLEAMASGTPVLTSKTSSLPEVAGSAAWLVDPTQTQQIVEGMITFGHDESVRSDFVEKGFQQIKNFSWDKAARETIKVYESTV